MSSPKMMFSFPPSLLARICTIGMALAGLASVGVHAEELKPLAVGNWWEYEVSRADSKFPPYKLFSEISEERTYRGEKWFLYGETFGTERFWERQTKDRFIQGDASRLEEAADYTIEFPFPATEGATLKQVWTFDSFDVVETREFTVTVVDTDRTVATAAGDFQCIVYEKGLSI